MSNNTDNRTLRVIITTPVWTLNGVNVFILKLARGLLARGIDAQVLITQPDFKDTKPMPVPEDVPLVNLPLPRSRSWKNRRRAMIDYLTEQAPCIYMPNHDFYHSCISPVLPAEVHVVGRLASDDPPHLDHMKRLGLYWDAVVCVSETLAEKARHMHPMMSDRVFHIPNGVPVDHGAVDNRLAPGDPIQLIYTGRIDTAQKRVDHLLEVAAELKQRAVPFQLDLVGGGEESAYLSQCYRSLVDDGSVRFVGIIPNDDVWSMYKDHHVFVLASAFEGMSNAMLEAASCGCVPVITGVESGASELVADGENGFLIDVGDTATFADRIAELQANPALLHQMSQAAKTSIVTRGLTDDAMVERYLDLFRMITDEKLPHPLRMPDQPIQPPPHFYRELFFLRIRPFTDFALAARRFLRQLFTGSNRKN